MILLEVYGFGFRPIPDTVTWTVEVAIAGAAGGVCLTLTLQLAPGARVRPEVQLPPVAVNVPEPPVRAIVGVADSFSDEALAVLVLVMVMVPFLTVRLGVPVVKPVAVNDRTEPVTWNCTLPVVPAGVVTDTA